ncbi:MAG: SDR family oxidoreductase [Candidatus Latescibacterota bacterium]
MKILVTGSSSGIGLALCQKLLQEGREVVGIARRQQPLTHPAFTAVSIDLSNLDALPQALDNLRRVHGPFSGLVCNAGRGHFGDLEQFSYAQMRALLDLDFTSQAFLARAFLPDMKKNKSGHIVFTGSEAALSGTQKGSIYCAAKFALRGFAQALREETARHGIRITLINPGMVRTPFFDTLDFQPDAGGDYAIDPEDIAHVIAQALAARDGTVIDEINISPQKKRIDFKKDKGN